MNEKDWNVTDGLQRYERLYVKRAPSRVPVIINNSIVHLPEAWLEDAYILDDGGEIEEGYSLIRIPNYNNARGKVKNSDIVFYTQTMPEKTYTHRLEIGNPFRYTDTSSDNPFDSQEVEDAPEWLNNICNRIDELEAQVEQLQEFNEELSLGIDIEMKHTIETYDFRNIVMSIIESPSFAHMIYNTVKQQSIRYQDSMKTLKDIWDSNTPLQYRDKGWK